MPVISNTYVAVANARSANVLAGEQFEFVPGRAALITARMTTTAVGLKADFQIGGEAVVTNASISNANRFPQAPDDVLVNGVGARGGERLFLTIYNTTAGPLTVTYVIEITPL